MKASWWKYVLLALLTAGVVACGKDNSGSGTGVSTNPIYNGVGTAPVSNSFAEFKQQVNSHQFVGMQHDYERYYYYNIDYQADNNNCDKWWIFSICSSSSNSNAGQFTRSFSKFSGTGTHEWGTPDQVLQKLKDIVNRAQNGTKYGQSSWVVLDSDGSYYIIDLAAPVMANPLYYRPANVNSTDGYSYWYYEY